MTPLIQRIAITGANGFIGKALCPAAVARRWDVVALTRTSFAAPDGVRNVIVGNIGIQTQWERALTGCDVLVHLAAYQPVKAAGKAELDLCRQVNVQGTENLARQAARAGVRRLVFVSSVKVNGQISPRGRPFNEGDASAPVDAYGISKQEAEQRLCSVARDTGMEIVIVRPPLVYGAGVGGNVGSLVRVAKLGVPLPLMAINNRRSMVSQSNLIDFLLLCCEHPVAAKEVFFVSDGDDVSVAKFVMCLGAAMGVRQRLFSVPMWMLTLSARVFGRSDVFVRIGGDLQVDISKARRMLGWNPPQTFEDGLRQLADSQSHA